MSIAQIFGMGFYASDRDYDPGKRHGHRDGHHHSGRSDGHHHWRHHHWRHHHRDCYYRHW